MLPKGSKKYDDKECTIEGCHKKPYARRLCAYHYGRLIVKKLPLYVRPPARICKHPGCDNKCKAKGYCSLHYARNRQGTDMDKPKGYYYKLKIDRNKAVVLMRSNGYTLESIGDILGITHERVRQIIAKYT